MKKRFGLIALLLTVVFMLSSCQLIQAFNAFKELANEIRDSISVYVANGTDASITVYYEQDPVNLKDGATPQKGSFTLNKDAVKEKAFTTGYFKLIVNNEQVMPGEDASRLQSSSNSGYYDLSPNTKITIKEDTDGKYIYTSESRSSN